MPSSIRRLRGPVERLLGIELQGGEPFAVGRGALARRLVIERARVMENRRLRVERQGSIGLGLSLADQQRLRRETIQNELRQESMRLRVVRPQGRGPPRLAQRQVEIEVLRRI